ncbi:MAG: hypothetical protein R3F20_00845 [Planctomycetota bacterium]
MTPMRFDETIELYLANSLDPEEREAVERRRREDPEFEARIREEERLRGRLRQACGERLSPLARQAIWSRFEAAVELETVPAATTPPRFRWNVFAVPAAAAAIALTLWGAGLFDGGAETVSPEPDGIREVADAAPTIFEQSPIINAVFAADRKFRGKIGSTRVDQDVYRRRVERALEGEALVSHWFSDSPTTTRQSKIGEIEKLLSSCARQPVQVPVLPDCAHIEACCIHEVETPAATYRIPHVMLCCGGRKVSAYYLCGSLRPLIEEAMRTCGDLGEKRLEDGRPTRLHQCQECGVVIVPRGRHIIVLTSDLDAADLDEIAARF